MGFRVDGHATMVTNPLTGELFAAISLYDWERLVGMAVDFEPCADACGAKGCELAKRIAELNRDVESLVSNAPAANAPAPTGPVDTNWLMTATDAVGRAAAMAERAMSFAKDRMAALDGMRPGPGAYHLPAEWRAQIERELSNAFIVGYAARDEQTAAGRLPRPRSKRK